jgi:peptidyl-tRNA hydrolase, PTH2 family
MNTKQVIVIRKDLKMRRGKEIAQASHASMSFITRRLQRPSSWFKLFWLVLKIVEIKWLSDSFAKVVCQVDSEEELLEIEKKAKEANLEVHLIIDNGRTEFNGVPTATCLALGPDECSKIDKITGGLKLY